MEEYVTGTGQRMRVHPKTDNCKQFGCTIHNPTDPHKDWPTHWREDRAIMERICPHGVGHPDKDHLNFIARNRGEEIAYWEGQHGCDGCCREESDDGE